MPLERELFFVRFSRSYLPNELIGCGVKESCVSLLFFIFNVLTLFEFYF